MFLKHESRRKNRPIDRERMDYIFFELLGLSIQSRVLDFFVGRFAENGSDVLTPQNGRNIHRNSGASP
jgi:hypothetical protein